MTSLETIFGSAAAIQDKNYPPEVIGKITTAVNSNMDKIYEAQEKITKEICEVQSPPETQTAEQIQLKYVRKIDDPRVMWVVFDENTKRPTVFTTTLTGKTTAMINHNFLFKQNVTLEDLKKLYKIADKLNPETSSGESDQ